MKTKKGKKVSIQSDSEFSPEFHELIREKLKNPILKTTIEELANHGKGVSETPYKEFINSGLTLKGAMISIMEEMIEKNEIKKEGISESQRTRAQKPRPTELNDLIKNIMEENPHFKPINVFYRLKKMLANGDDIIENIFEDADGKTLIEWIDNKEQKHLANKSGLSRRMSDIRKKHPHLKRK